MPAVGTPSGGEGRGSAGKAEAELNVVVGAGGVGSGRDVVVWAGGGAGRGSGRGRDVSPWKGESDLASESFIAELPSTWWSIDVGLRERDVREGGVGSGIDSNPTRGTVESVVGALDAGASSAIVARRATRRSPAAAGGEGATDSVPGW